MAQILELGNIVKIMLFEEAKVDQVRKQVYNVRPKTPTANNIFIVSGRISSKRYCFVPRGSRRKLNFRIVAV